MESLVAWVLEALQQAPAWWYLAALSLLPLAGFPISPLWIVCGIVFGTWLGMTLATAGMAVNFVLAYFISNRWLRGFLEPRLKRRYSNIPEAKPGEYVRLTVAVRVMPGVPQFIQSYLLGLANVPFLTYYLFSFPPQLIWAAGFVILGESLFALEGGGLLLAGSILLSGALLIGVLRNRNVDSFPEGGESP